MNALASSFFKRATRPAVGVSLAASLLGDAISALPSAKFKHPWYTTPSWNALAKRWVATVKPGFVNAETPVYRATIQEQQDLGNPSDVDPITGEQFPKSGFLDLPLYLDPAIPLDFYGIGFDGDPTAGVPEFFLQLGAAKLPAGQSLDNATPPKKLRLLRACDLWLHQPRTALTSTVTLDPSGFITGKGSVNQTLSIAAPAPSDVLRVFQGFFRPIDATAGIDPLSFDFTEPDFDQLLISTVYLLSPAGAEIGSVPDSTWTAYVRHNLFWNLHWAQPFFQQVDSDPGTPFIPPLAGGVAQLAIGFLASSLNDATQQALNILTAHTMAGTFWTPTGGGSDATFAALATAQASTAKTGPDKAANAAAKSAAEAAQRRALQLDPAFPYRGQAFPREVLAA